MPSKKATSTKEQQMAEHRTQVASNPHKTRYWWVCDCGEKGKQKFFYAYAERDGKQHVKDKAGS
jgi:hypothetical protein